MLKSGKIIVHISYLISAVTLEVAIFMKASLPSRRGVVTSINALTLSPSNFRGYRG